MAEEEAKARRELEKADHEAENDARRNDVILYHNGVRRGQVLTFLIIMSCIGGSLYAARIGAHTLASILAGVSFTGIAYHLVSSIKRK